MAIGAIGGAAVPFTPPSIPAAGSAGATAPVKGHAFAESLQSVEELTRSADSAANGVATGSLQDIHQFTVAAARASLGVELTAALRDRAVGAYQEIMRMQV